MSELKKQLIGQKEGMQFALEELKIIEESIQNRIKFLDLEIENIKE